MKRLAYHPDFQVLIQNTAADLALRPELVLKDYWVTAILRLLAGSPFRGSFLFKGGTSLSKGWKLIDRFSEDVDLLLTGPNFSAPPERQGEREKRMRDMRDYVLAELPLKIPDVRDKQFYFRDQWHMIARYFWKLTNPPSPEADQSILLEAGFRGGVNPYTKVSLNSMVGDFLLARQLEVTPALQDYQSDCAPFELELLAPSRTFCEKLLHLSGALRGDGADLRTRHLYDVVQIFRQDPKIKVLIQSDDFRLLLEEAVEVSNRYYETNINANEIKFRSMLIIRDDQVARLTAAYRAESVYYYRGQPDFAELHAGLEEIRLSFAD